MKAFALEVITQHIDKPIRKKSVDSGTERIETRQRNCGGNIHICMHSFTCSDILKVGPHNKDIFCVSN